ncbi:MAG: hypothetical protein ACOVNY_07745 [Chitinophagaceae bacterium]
MKIVLINFLILFLTQSKSYAQFDIKSCQKEPLFISKFGFNPKWAALSTSEKSKIGLALIELLPSNNEKAPNNQSIKGRMYQHHTWTKAGYLATIALDVQGNVFTIPAPLVSFLHNNPLEQNIIYKIDYLTGIMQKWKSLPLQKIKGYLQNPYGLLGLTYDCTSNMLFASSVQGSNRYQEKGIIYEIHATTKKIVDTLQGKDVMGLAVNYDNKGNKKLYFGTTRTGHIYSIVIGKSGQFEKQTIQLECSLEGLGPRGDDKARKIKFVNGNMIVNGVAFNYNLQASSEKPETTYVFSWNNQQQIWDLIDLK